MRLYNQSRAYFLPFFIADFATVFFATFFIAFFIASFIANLPIFFFFSRGTAAILFAPATMPLILCESSQMLLYAAKACDHL